MRGWERLVEGQMDLLQNKRTVSLESQVGSLFQTLHCFPSSNVWVYWSMRKFCVEIKIWDWQFKYTYDLYCILFKPVRLVHQHSRILPHPTRLFSTKTQPLIGLNMLWCLLSGSAYLHQVVLVRRRVRNWLIELSNDGWMMDGRRWRWH